MFIHFGVYSELGGVWNDERLKLDTANRYVLNDDIQKEDFRMGILLQTPASLFDETWGYLSRQERGNPQGKAEEKLKELIKVIDLMPNELNKIEVRLADKSNPHKDSAIEDLVIVLQKNP